MDPHQIGIMTNEEVDALPEPEIVHIERGDVVKAFMPGTIGVVKEATVETAEPEYCVLHFGTWGPFMVPRSAVVSTVVL